MKVIITGANSAVGQAILRWGSKHAALPNTFIAAVRSQRAAQQIRSQLGDTQGAVQVSYDEPDSLGRSFPGRLRGHPSRRHSRGETGFDI